MLILKRTWRGRRQLELTLGHTLWEQLLLGPHPTMWTCAGRYYFGILPLIYSVT